MAITQRLDRRLDDEVGRAEIRLADTEIDDVAALRRMLHGSRQHGESIFLADAIKCGDGLEHGVSPGGRFRAAVHPKRKPNANIANAMDVGVVNRDTLRIESPGPGPGLPSTSSKQVS